MRAEANAFFPYFFPLRNVFSTLAIEYAHRHILHNNDSRFFCSVALPRFVHFKKSSALARSESVDLYVSIIQIRLYEQKKVFFVIHSCLFLCILINQSVKTSSNSSLLKAIEIQQWREKMQINEKWQCTKPKPRRESSTRSQHSWQKPSTVCKLVIQQQLLYVEFFLFICCCCCLFHLCAHSF